MGIIIGKFRKKKTTLELLEKLEKEIKDIEGTRRDAELARKRFAGRFIILSFGLYFIVAFIICYYFLPSTTSERVKYIAPLLCVPILLLFMRKILGWYYNKKLLKNQSKLKTLKDEKKKMLDKVMDTETYKVAKEILEKFAPEQVRKTAFPSSTSTDIASTVKALQTPTASGLRLRNSAAIQQASSQLSRSSYFGVPGTPAAGGSALKPMLPALPSTLPRSTSLQSTANMALSSMTPVSMARSILPRHRSVLDKMVEYLIGDGPSNRYALICKSCDAHNGMALKEEFEYLSFRCCYCHTLNPARKQRPFAPRLKLDNDQTVSEIKNNSDTSDSEKNSAESSASSDSERDENNLTTLYSTSMNTTAINKERRTKITELEPMEVDSSEALNINKNKSSSDDVEAEEEEEAEADDEGDQDKSASL